MDIPFSKRAGYFTYGVLYGIFKLLPVRDDMAYFIMTHDCSDEGNCGVMKTFLEKCPVPHKHSRKRSDSGFVCRTLTRADTRKPLFIFKSAWNLAHSRYVFTDNAFLPLAFLKLRPKTTLVQLWHGTGTIKKFGQHVNKGALKALEARCARNITYATVSSKATRDIYSECFALPRDRVVITGLPRSDIFFSEGFATNARTGLENDYPVLKGRRLLLYAPTFRDKDKDCTAQVSIIRSIIRMLGDCFSDDICLGLRLHPFVAQQAAGDIKTLETTKIKVIDFSEYHGLNSILGATDILISDYSSIVFEYSILNRPMIFYAYDLAEFETDGRGFYRNYRTYVPGPVVTTPAELKAAISDALNTPFVSHSDFTAEAFAFTDGKSASRIYQLIERQ